MRTITLVLMPTDETSEEQKYAREKAKLDREVQRLCSEARPHLREVFLEIVKHGDPGHERAQKAGIRLGFGGSMISNYINLKGRLPDAATIFRISLITGQSADQILGLRTRLEPRQLIQMVRRLETQDLQVLLDELRAMRIIPDVGETSEGLSVVTAPRGLPPQLPPASIPEDHAAGDDESHQPPAHATKKKRPRRR